MSKFTIAKFIEDRRSTGDTPADQKDVSGMDNDSLFSYVKHERSVGPRPRHLELNTESLEDSCDLTERLCQKNGIQSKEQNKKRLYSLSMSCPSLAEPVRALSVTPIPDGGHHNSMNDLLDDVDGRTQPVSPVNLQNDRDESKHSSSLGYHLSEKKRSYEQDHNISQSNETADGLEDHPEPSSSNFHKLQDSGGTHESEENTMNDESEQVNAYRRGSLDYERSCRSLDLLFDFKDQSNETLSSSERRDSSYSLGENKGSEEGDIPDSLTDEHLLAMIKQEMGTSASFAVEETSNSSDSSPESSIFSPDLEMPLPGVIRPRNKILENLKSSFHQSRSFSELDAVDQISENNDMAFIGSYSLPGNRNFYAFRRHSGDDALEMIIRSKYQSTSQKSEPSVTSDPAALILKDKQKGRLGYLFQIYETFLEIFLICSAQFYQHKEIEEAEEEDEEDYTPSRYTTSRTLPRVWSRELPQSDSDEKWGKLEVKEETKRKSNVLAKIQSTYKRGKREKSKSKNHHQFVAISVSNATTCDVCQKSMVNKAALRCENCLLTVHEHNCQDQIVGCDKSRRKALHRDGSSHGAQGPTQTAQSVTMEQRPPLAGTSLRHTQSMVHRRPMSINIQRHLPGQRFGKSLSMTGRTTSEESDTSPVTMAESRKGSMDDSIYESLESPDGMIPPEILLNDEPDLQLLVYEPETWISTVPEEVQNKLNKRDIERQHNIWELIGTEKQYVKRLKIMQKIFAKPLLHEMNYPENLVNQLFPQLDELVELHTKFLRQLLNRQARNENRFVNEIGDILVAQFQGSTADKMKSIYGVFCSRQAETVQLYKELMKTDKKFMSFIKKCSKLPVCEKREISEFILVVTHRLTKYGILMEQILKNTTDEKDWENLDQALLSCKNVVQQIDDKVAAYIKLKDIQNKMDPRTVKFKGKKFTRMDLTADKRELLHVGLIGWKNSKDQVIETLALVLTDLLVFLQKNEQKLTFLMQDNKQPVISLHNLMVKQKQDLQDNLGIFIINPDHKNPEMYELVCKSKKFREDWIMILQDAIRACPPDKEPVLWPGRNSPGPVLSNMLEKHRRSEYTSQVKNIIEKLHQKDEIIKECCDAKNKLMLELLELSTPCSEPGSRTNSQEIDSLSESMEIVHAAMQEASRLTNILQSSSTILNRSISNTFEYHSNTLAPSPVPKRGETFSNSESFHVSKRRGSNNIFGSIEQEEIEEQLLSMQYQDQPKAKRNSLDIQETSLEFKCGDDGNARKESMSSDQSSDQDSFGELSASVTSLVPSLSSQEQMTSVFHLVQYLNALMNLTSKQCTKVEILRSELAEAKEEISKLSADMHNRRLCSVGQLEELRNLQEVINQEKQEWERKKLEDFSRLETERKKLEDELLKIRVEKMDLDVHKEDLKKEQKVLQSQIEMLNDLRQGLQVCSTPDNILKGAHLENVSKNSTTQQGPINHERSESADLYDTVYTTDFENIQSCPQYAWKSNVGDSHLTNLTDSLQDQNPATAAASNNHNTFPQHLTYSHNNNNNVNVEDSPEKECWI